MRTRRLVGATSVILLTLGVYAVGLAQTVAAQGSCQLSVSPKSAVAGTTFELNGSGFTPTQLILQKDGGKPVTLPLDLKGADPFQIPIGSRKGDEGAWHATAALPGTCSPSIVFTVTLESTDAVSDAIAAASAPAGSGHLPVGVYLLVIVAGFGGGAFVTWRLKLA